MIGIIETLLAVVFIFKLLLAFGVSVVSFLVVKKIVRFMGFKEYENEFGFLAFLLSFVVVYFYFLASIIVTAISVVTFYFFGSSILIFLTFLAVLLK